MNKSAPPANSPQPTPESLARQSGPIWTEFCGSLERRYAVKPRLEYSVCSMMRGWNVKYKKGSRSLCTLYPGEGQFACLVVVGAREADAVEQLLPALSPATRRIYREAKPLNGGRWLMLEITDPAACRDALELICIKAGN